MSKTRDTKAAITDLMLALPSTESVVSHGMANYRIAGGKTFATLALNHHGDGRIALWLNVPAGMQESYVAESARHFFKPPYVGPHGWLGVRLDSGLVWSRVASLAEMAFKHTAPPRVAASFVKPPRVAPPNKILRVADIDPKNFPAGKRVLAAMRKACLALPDSSEGEQFGQPVWRVGKKVFAQAYCYSEGWRVSFWVGIPAQTLMVRDRRFSIPQYTGHNGWIALDATRRLSPPELAALALTSYRHYATRRQLAALAALDRSS